MTSTNDKPGACANKLTGPDTTEYLTANYTRPIPARIKGFIVALALWGLVPVKLAEWIIGRGGLRHE